ncbi:MAG: RluA family pseudouridine synthase [Myxococcaceae bacterium]
MIEITIDDDNAGQRLDKFLRRHLNQVPTSHLFKMIRTKKVRVNGKRATPEQVLAKGDTLFIRGDKARLENPLGAPSPRTRPSPPPVDPQKLVVLLEDDWIMAIDKPSGMAVHPGSGISGGTAVDYVRAHLGIHAERNGFLASPAHRLDRDTSGVLLVAKRRPAMVHFTEVFTEGKAKKRYWALVKGKMPELAGTIDLPLSEKQQTAASKSRRGTNFQEATTHWRVLAQGNDSALLECRIETGRTHQIRRHLEAIGHPVSGDRRYGDFAFNRELRARWGLKRMFLHASQIEFPHPESKAWVKVVSSLPTDLSDVLARAALSVP